MTLKKWLRISRMRPYHLAQKAGISAATLHYHLVKGKPLGARIALKIEKYTKGDVTLRELVAAQPKRQPTPTDPPSVNPGSHSLLNLDKNKRGDK